jgi:hypothetical protein
MIARRAGSALRSRLWLLFVLVLACLNCLTAQNNPGTRLNDYVGTYADAPGHTIEIVAGDRLFAVVDEAKYPLCAAGLSPFLVNVLSYGMTTVRRLRSHPTTTALRL